MLENMRSAFQGIWSHKLRSFLTMLGVIIGIASIISIVSTIKGTNEQIMQNLIGAGNNNVKVSLYQGEESYWMDGGAPAGIRPVSEEQKEKIRSLEDVSDASFYLYRNYLDSVTYNGQSLDSARIAGVDMHYLTTCGYEVYSGRRFTGRDYAEIRKVALLDQTAADLLFPDGAAAGNTIDIKGEPFTVAGVFRKKDDFQPVINSFQDYVNYHQEEYGAILIPDVCWPILYAFDEPETCVARAAETEKMSDVGKAVESIMNESVSTPAGDSESAVKYKAEDLLETVRNKQQLSQSTNSLLVWIAGIALLVGGIGVMNIMLVSVSERTSEIGLKKALGAKKRRILAQFLTESAMLTSMGGALGVAAGLILARVISKISGAPVAISIPAIILGVAFSMLIGIVFGLLPSVKAANLNPIEALQRE